MADERRDEHPFPEIFRERASWWERIGDAERSAIIREAMMAILLAIAIFT
ncbi:hypothetical protein JW899_05200 [Candidatus Uhrbacteria bacterium]|nr:hypothetical protein [Candidatus Uhrbacteria bacterium]